MIPYGVGVDIGCRMCLSILDIPQEQLEKNASVFKRELIAGTVFGAGAEWKPRLEDEVLEHPAFNEIGLLKHLHQKAAAQLSTSGSGTTLWNGDWWISPTPVTNGRWRRAGTSGCCRIPVHVAWARR